MGLNFQTRISGITTEVAPGGLIEGTVEITAAKPLTLAELSLTLTGRATSRIFRELSIAVLPAQARWKGKMTVCERILVLVDYHTNLEPGDHHFPFRLRIPETTEIVTGSQKNGKRKEWEQRAPFVEGQTSHPLPPTFDVKSEQGHIFLHGDAAGSIEYELSITRKSTPREWKIAPAFVQKIKMAAPLVTRAEEVKWFDISKPLGGGYRDVVVSVKCPTPIIQWEALPIQVGVLHGEGFALVSLKVKLWTQYVVRGQTWLLPENSSPVVSEEKLIAWEGKMDLSPGQYQFIRSQPLSATQLIAKFSTLNVACTAHELEIKYKVQDGKGRVISGISNRVAVEIQGPNRPMEGRSESPRTSMGAAEYRLWVSERSG
ncbi:hypothetical protein BJX63DRAFT_438573 [Aspergillus granulosus]|uniref:Arrestin-like N-terminal domain-containing protein n=1 Tax=Aspergillus granulosus TaxID=176169 RepID=A0ABR4GRK8_9EURO